MYFYILISSCVPPHPQFKSLLPSFNSRVVERELVLSDDGAAVFVSRVRHHVEVGRPHLELPLPVDDGGEWSADQERTLGVTLRDGGGRGGQFIYSIFASRRNKTAIGAAQYLFEERVEEDNGLDGLAEAHLICQDGVCALSP